MNFTGFTKSQTENIKFSAVLPDKYVTDPFPDRQELILQTHDEPMSEGYFKFRGKSAYSRFRVRWR
jgi:hypothetical protein